MSRSLFRMFHSAMSMLFLVLVISWIATTVWPPNVSDWQKGWSADRWHVSKLDDHVQFRRFRLSVWHGNLSYWHVWPHLKERTSARPVEFDWKWRGSGIKMGTMYRRVGKSPRGDIAIAHFVDVKLPLAFVTILVGVYPVASLLFLPLNRYRLRRSGQCERCKYCLVGLPDPDYEDVAARSAIQAKQELLRYGRQLLRTAAKGGLLGIALIVGLSVIWFYVPSSPLTDSSVIEFIVFPLQPLTQTSWILLWLSTIAYYGALFLLCRLLFGLRLSHARRNDVPGDSQQEVPTARCPECGLRL